MHKSLKNLRLRTNLNKYHSLPVSSRFDLVRIMNKNLNRRKKSHLKTSYIAVNLQNTTNLNMNRVIM